jgi:hypothetical protein
VTYGDQQQPMTARGPMGEFHELDTLMHAAHAEALDALAERIDVEERLRQMLGDVEDPQSEDREPGSSGT